MHVIDLKCRLSFFESIKAQNVGQTFRSQKTFFFFFLPKTSAVMLCESDTNMVLGIKFTMDGNTLDRVTDKSEHKSVVIT